MLRYLLFLTFFQISNFSFGQASASDPGLVKTEDQFFAALKARDYTGLEAFYDDSFKGILATGKIVDKAAMVEYQKTSESYIAKSFENLETRIFGDVAISTGTEVNTAKTGTKLGQSRFIRIFIRKNNVWKIIECQYTTII